MADWIKHETHDCVLSTRNTLKHKDTHRLKGRKKIDHINSSQKKAGGTLLSSDKVDFGAKDITKDKEGHFITKGVNLSKGHNNPKHLCTS